MEIWKMKVTEPHVGRMSRREGPLSDHCSFKIFSVRTVILELGALLQLHSDNIFQENGNVPGSLNDFLFLIS